MSPPPPKGLPVELRIHGVSGTPPAQMLEHVDVVRVAGDRQSGFYRRSLATRDAPDEVDAGLEAYSWSGLTSGGATRVLWLLLAPFALVNTAVWARPPGERGSAPARFAQGALSAVLRLLALLLTGSLVVAAASIGMDLVAWQCGGSPECRAKLPWSWLLEELGTPGRRLAVGAAAPALLIVVLWALGRHTWRRYERVHPEPRASAGDDAVPLADPRFWDGDAAVRRLRVLHVASAWALLAGLVAYPLGPGHIDGAPVPAGPPWLLTGVVLAAAAVYAVCAVLMLIPGATSRARVVSRGDTRRPWLPGRSLLGLAMGLVVLALVIAVLPVPELGREADGPVVESVYPWGLRGRLPGVNEVLEAGAALQGALVLGLFALTFAIRRLAGHHRRSGDVRWPDRYAGPVLAAMGWLLAGGLWAGLTVRVGLALGSDDVLLPPVYSWVGAVTVGVLVLTVVTAAALWGHARWRRRAEAAAVLDDVAVLARAWAPDAGPYPPTTMKETARARFDERVGMIASARALARLSDRVGSALLALVGLSLVLVVGAAIWYQTTPAEARVLGLATGWASRLADAGTWLMGAAAIGFAALGYAAYRTPTLRAKVGVIWDVTSFWPRGAHPLAPPCYSERIIPDLSRRMTHLAKDGPVVVSAHSQGTVIALATLLQVQDAAPATAPAAAGPLPVALLTYGSPLRQLYQAFFPAYVNADAFARAMGAPDSTDGAEWPWRNLYRATDPIGGWLLDPRTTVTGPEDVAASLDLRLVDPVFTEDANPSWPETRGHGDYVADAAFAWARSLVVTKAAARAAGRRRPRRADPRQAAS